MDLILGANGFIGRHLHQLLAALGNELLGTYYPTGTTAARNQLLFLDITKSPASFWRRLPPLRRVFLCIQHGSLDDCCRRPAATAAVNVHGVMRALPHVQRLGGTPVFLSSNLVFAGTQKHYSEQSKPSPTTEYGRQKYAVEQYIRRHFRRYCIARLTKVFSTSRPDGYLFRQWLQTLRRGRPISATTGGVISPLWIADAVRALSILDPFSQPGIYHFTGPDAGSPAHYALRLARHFHCDVSLVRRRPASAFGWVERRPRYNLLDDRRTRGILHLRPAAIEAAFDYQSAIDARRHVMLPL